MSAVYFVYFYLSIAALVIYKIAKWLLAYVKNVQVINKIEGMPMLPFIGNMHQINFNRDGMSPLSGIRVLKIIVDHFKLLD